MEMDKRVRQYQGRPLRILCLHQQDQDIGSFKMQLDQLQTYCSRYLVEFVYCEAPHRRLDLT